MSVIFISHSRAGNADERIGRSRAMLRPGTANSRDYFFAAAPLLTKTYVP